MPRMLSNAQITHVSYVDKGANKKTFFLTKSEENSNNFETEVKVIAKEEGEQKLVYGIVYEPNVEDAHGDAMTAEEIEKAAHYFMKESRNIDKQHNYEAGFGEVVESYVAPADMAIGEQLIQKGSWVLVTKASDEIWEAIQKGEITGYSMAGVAEVEEVTKAEEKLFKKFLSMAKDFFSGQSNKEDDIKKEVELDMTPEQLQEVMKSVVGEALKPFEEKLSTLEKAVEVKKEEPKQPENPEQVEKTEEEKQEELKKSIAEVAKSAVEEALKPFSERLDTVEKARSNSKSLDTETVEKKKDTGVFDSLFTL